MLSLRVLTQSRLDLDFTVVVEVASRRKKKNNRNERKSKSMKLQYLHELYSHLHYIIPSLLAHIYILLILFFGEELLDPFISTSFLKSSSNSSSNSSLSFESITHAVSKGSGFGFVFGNDTTLSAGKLYLSSSNLFYTELNLVRKIK